MVVPSQLSTNDWGVIIVGTGVLLLTSGILVRGLGGYIRSGNLGESFVKNLRGARTYEGFEPDISRANAIVGKCENVLVVIFVLSNSYTALAVIFAAEGLVSLRSEDEEYPFHHLTGTMVNFTYSILFALFIQELIRVV